MPTRLLPCPFCGNANIRTTVKKDAVWCDNEECPNRRNTCSLAVWDTLPRALRWSAEPPVIAGDYYMRSRMDASEPWNKPFVVSFPEDYLTKLEVSPLWQYAGPIAPPVE